MKTLSSIAHFLSVFVRHLLGLKIKSGKTEGSENDTVSTCFRPILTVITLLYFLFFLTLLIALRWWGEKIWLLSFLLFFPATVWLMPFLLLVPFHLRVRPTLCLFTLVVFLFVGFVYLDFCWSFAGDQNKPGLTVLTNNIGERDFHTLAPFLKAEDPDVVALQEGWTARLSWNKEFPNRFVVSQGEYILASKYPILKSGYVPGNFSYGRPLGAWFELLYQGRAVVLYSIHMPTPRSEFDNLRGNTSVRKLRLGRGIFSRQVRENYERFLKEQSRLTSQLIDTLRRESRPCIVVGDFNKPANSNASRLLRSEMIDAFQEKGRGYGNTFPGTSDDWRLHFFGKWLRLDYLFASKNWKPLMCRVEPDQPAQHLAVVARFQLQPGAHKP